MTRLTRSAPGKTNLKKLLLPFALLALCQQASAQQPPSGGGLLQLPSPPPVAREAPSVRIEPAAGAAAPAAGQPRILVRTLRVTGATLYTEAELLALTGFTAGSELALSDLEAMAARITEHYRRNGYFVAQAFVPAQDIRDNAVSISVREGRLGKVDLRNQTNLSDRVARDSLAGLDSGEVISLAPFENRLLLLSDVPGVHVKSTLVPGTEPGTSDLVVDVTPGQRITGSVDFDNAGNRYTGEYRLGATVNVNNPLGLGDVASLRVLTSGSGLNYARASYQLQVGRGQVGIAYSRLDYKLGREFEALDAHGTAEIASIYGRYPLLRSRQDNVSVQLALDSKRFDDRVDTAAAVSERRSNVLSASIVGDHRDRFGGGGLTAYSLTFSAGNLDIRTPAVLARDALTARSDGAFQKLGFHAMRLQRLGGPFSLHAGVRGQLASKNLDVSEKMELGGMDAVRAYPEGEAYGDEGLLVNLEARMDLPRLWATMPGHMQLVAFVDAGSVKQNNSPWAPGDNRRTLSGAGIGANWGDPGNFLARVYYARKLGNEDALSAPDRSGRLWFQLVKYF